MMTNSHPLAASRGGSSPSKDSKEDAQQAARLRAVTTPEDVFGASDVSDGYRTKTVILIRHGRSTWNEFLGAHKKADWEEQEKKRTGFRGALKQMVGLGQAAHETDLVEDKSEGMQGGFWQGVRGGVKHAVNAITHAGRLNQVDHPLSIGGLNQARALRNHVAALIADPREGPASVVLRCRQWFISPFLRALQTAAYALGPLHRKNPALRLQVTPHANEIVNNNMALDCQGKKGNVGFRMIVRAIGKLAETFEEDEDDPKDRGLTASRQAELAEVSNILCAMDLSQVSDKPWWTDISGFSKEYLASEDTRVRELIGMLMAHPEPCVGVVAHSLLFRRFLQLAWPKDPTRQIEVRAALQHASEHKDPLQDKMMNCGVLSLTMRYRVDATQSAEITRAEFLFDTHMESGLSREMQTEANDQLEDLEHFFRDTDLQLL